MKSNFRSHHAWLVLGIPAAFAFATASADGPSADTSDWKCTQCPFLQGYAAETEVGALGVSGANAYFGRYTGIDHDGAYADASGSGQYRNADGSYADYDLEHLGLASREGYVEGGSEGRYDLRVSYDGQPVRLYDTGSTPFKADGSNVGLPTPWIPAGSTDRMLLLDRVLHPSISSRIGAPSRCSLATSRVPAGPSSGSFGTRSMTAPASPARAS